MANGCAQVFGSLLATLGLICLIIATSLNEWKTESHTKYGTQMLEITNVGLWMKCDVKQSTQQCAFFDSLLHQTTEIQVTRAFMILSIVLSVCGLSMAILGMKCTLCLDAAEAVKNKVAFAGGMILVFSGVCALGIVSWYANGVIASFYSERRFTLGRCLFWGWGGALLSIFGGAFLVCCSLSKSTPRRTYSSSSPAQTVPSKEYV